MRISSLTTMTAVALLAFSPAFAAGEKTTKTNGTSAETRMEMQNNGAVTGTAQDTWRGQGVDTRAAYDTDSETWEVAILGADGEPEYQTVWQSNTAEGILDKEVKNINGKTIASVEDIIIDSGGNAQNVIVTHGGFLGLGEDRVALDYDQVIARGVDGDTLNIVSEDVLDQARPFSYDQTTSGKANQMTMASTNVSVDKVIGAEVRDPMGEAVATAENIQFKNGRAENVLLSLDDGMGEDVDRVALDFAELQLVREDDSYHFELTTAQADTLRDFQDMSDTEVWTEEPYSDMDTMPESRPQNGGITETEEY